ncbi:MAG: helix-turn-helix transcriptional regulator [bacterium]|nr:helix-turn-helix transcriptional regulator [bacterium]
MGELKSRKAVGQAVSTLRPVSNASHNDAANDSGMGSLSVVNAPQVDSYRQSVRARKRRKVSNPLRDYRLIRGLTLDDLAKMTDLSPSYLSRLEGGSRRLNVDILNKLATSLDCQASDLIGGSIEGGQTIPSVAQDLPLYEFQNSESGTLFIDFAQPTSWVYRLTELSDAGKAFAVQISNDDFSPRYRAQDRLFVHPTKSLTLKCTTLVTLTSQHTFVGQFMGWRSSQESVSTPIEASPDDFLVIEPITGSSSFTILKGVEVESGMRLEEGKLLIPRGSVSSAFRIIGALEAAA